MEGIKSCLFVITLNVYRLISPTKLKSLLGYVKKYISIHMLLKKHTSKGK